MSTQGAFEAGARGPHPPVAGSDTGSAFRAVLSWLARVPATLRTRARAVESASARLAEEEDDLFVPTTFDPNPSLPPNEHPRLQSVWVVDVFPPSRLPVLLAGLKRLGWTQSLLGGPIIRGIRVARQDRAARKSWRVHRLVPRESRETVWGDIPTEFPEGVRETEVHIYQPIPSVTVLVVYFVFDDATAAEIEAPFPRRQSEGSRDGAWRGWPRSDWVRRDVNRVRRQLRLRCLEWTAARLPGLFAGAERSATAEFITLEEARPFEKGASSGFPEYLRVLDLGFDGGSAVPQGDLRLCPLSTFLRPRAGLLLSGRDGDVAQAAIAEGFRPDHVGGRDGPSVARARKWFVPVMVFWALSVQLKHYTARFSALRDALAGLPADPAAERRRLAGIQREFVALLNDAVPFASELRALMDDDRWFGDYVPEFRVLDDTPESGPAAPLDELREQVRIGADHLARLIAEVREVTTTTGAILNAISQDEATRANLSLQRRVGILTIITVLIAILDLLFPK